MDVEYINKAEAFTACCKLSAQDIKKQSVFVVQNGCAYFVTYSKTEYRDAALIAEFKNGVQLYPEIYPDIEPI